VPPTFLSVNLLEACMTLKKTSKKESVNTIPAVDIKSKNDAEDRLYRIAVSAYYKAEARGYEPGHEIQDWLEAEAEILH
jgi:hypothetical protein